MAQRTTRRLVVRRGRRPCSCVKSFSLDHYNSTCSTSRLVASTWTTSALDASIVAHSTRRLSTSRLVASTCRPGWRPRPQSNRSRGRRVAPPNVQPDDSRLYYCDRQCAEMCARRLQNRRARRESMVNSTSLRVSRALGTVEPIASANRRRAAAVPGRGGTSTK